MKNNNLNISNTSKSSTIKASVNAEDKLPKFINLEKWEDVGFNWEGTIIPRDMPRMVGIVAGEYLDKPIDLKFEIKKVSQLLVLNMEFSGSICTLCQRCLEPLNIDVSHQNQLILLENESQESLVDESDDYLMLDELLENNESNKKDERLLPIAKLIEDELLLDIPLSAKHDDCEMAVEQVGEIIEEEAENPFAALADLKGKL